MLQPSLESTDPSKPDLRRISSELENAATDATHYLSRVERSRGWWHNIWRGASWDGRKHAEGEQDIVTPWEGASDSRLRIVSTLIKEHVSLAKAAFWGARLSVRATRPMVYGRLATIAQKVLEWHVYTQMRREVNHELSLAWGWRFGFGLSFMSIEWEQQRTVSEEPVTLQDLMEISQQLQLPELVDLGGGEEAEDEIIGFLQKISPILDKGTAKKCLSELRNDGTTFIPVINYIVNKPRWEALLPCVDVIFPSEAWDIQRERFISRRELVTESELVDRIETDGYDEEFVEEAKKQKGEFSDWLAQPNWRFTNQGSERDLIELHHFLHRNVESGIPTIYKTVFSSALIDKNLCAVHKVFEYSHQQYPLVALRRSHDFRPVLSSIGIAEEAYTDERDIKFQQDGITDRTEIINRPPMVVPVMRALGAKNMYGPGAIMPSLRGNDVSWPPLPPSDSSPVTIIEMVQARLDRRYSISGPSVDQQMRIIRQQELAQDINIEIELMLEQTLKLAQQFDTDEVVKKVAGDPQGPWNPSVEDIQGEYEITVTRDMRLDDITYVKEKVGLFQQVMGMNQAGTAKLNKFFSAAANMLDPDAADMVQEDEQDATEKERSDEKAAASQIMTGIEPDKPMSGNHKLRLQTLIESTIQSQSPFVQQTIAQRKDVQDLLKNRIKHFQNQIQQYQVNPQIGRQLSTKTFAPNQPADVTP